MIAEPQSLRRSRCGKGRVLACGLPARLYLLGLLLLLALAGTTEKMFSGPGAGGGQELLVEHDQGSHVYLLVSNADSASAAAFKQNFMKLVASFQT